MFAARLAVEFRQKFKKDIFLDVVGYRKYGHNELDEPAFTQPLMYKNIRSRPSVVTIYANKLKVRINHILFQINTLNLSTHL